MDSIKKTEITTDDLILIQQLQKEYEKKRKELVEKIYKEMIIELTNDS